MNARQKYRQFLKSDFWIKLSKRKKNLDKKCSECGSVENLQAHHKFYRKDWFDTRIDDLVVLCRQCHESEHGIVKGLSWTGKFIIFRDDYTFSLFMHRMQWMRNRMVRTGRRLKRREIWYLNHILETYPPSKSDGCIDFHVKSCLKMSETVHTFI